MKVDGNSISFSSFVELQGFVYGMSRNGTYEYYLSSRGILKIGEMHPLHAKNAAALILNEFLIGLPNMSPKEFSRVFSNLDINNVTFTSLVERSGE